MQLVITIRKEVADPNAGQAVLDMVRAKLSDHPDVAVDGHVTNHFEPDTPLGPPE